MLKVLRKRVYNFEMAIRGMRNPMESWDKSDSNCFIYDEFDARELITVTLNNVKETDHVIEFQMGEEDMKLAKSLVKAGSDHRKFMRQIFVCMDITAPLYWFKEMDTYKVATVANSTSTMHKLGSRPLTPADFSWDKMTDYRNRTLNHLNILIGQWKKAKEAKGNPSIAKEIWRELIQDLPTSDNQTRTWSGNYETLRGLYPNRSRHKLTEWEMEFCKEVERLPYSELITMKANEEEE